MKNELVESKKGKVYSTSLVFAKEFEIAHIHVLEKIRNLIIETPIVKSSFIESKYKNERGREYPIYYLDRDGFMFLVMNTVGKRSNEMKLRFIGAFNAMENALLRQSNEEWNQSRKIGMTKRKELTDTIQRFIEYAKNQGSTKAEFYYKHITNAEYKALHLLDSNETTPVRDMLSDLDLGFLMVAEHIAKEFIEECMESDIHYKEIFVLLKQKLMVFAQAITLKSTHVKELKQ